MLYSSQQVPATQSECRSTALRLLHCRAELPQPRHHRQLDRRYGIFFLVVADTAVR